MGNGTSEFIDGVYYFDLAVTFANHAASSTIIDEWKKSFRRASKILFDATDGQAQFRTLTVTNDGSVNDEDDAFLWPTDGKSMTIYRPPKGPLCGYMSLMLDEKRKPFVIVHEFGHYGFYLGDEYKKVHGTKHPRCTQDAEKHHACIMEFSWKEGDIINSGGNVEVGIVSEFCVDDNHNKATGTGQHKRHKQACWDTIKKFYPQVAVPVTPTDIEPAGHVPVVFNMLSSVKEFAIVVAGSKAISNSRSETAIRGALRFWIDFLYQNNHSVALISAAEDPPVVQGITRVDSQAKRQQLMNVVDTIRLDSNEKLMPALRAAHTQLARPGTKPSFSAILLISDGGGGGNVDLNPIIGQLARDRIRLRSLTVGDGPVNQALTAVRSRRWIKHFAVTAAAQDADVALSVQGEAINLAYDTNSGFELVASHYGRIPSVDVKEASSGVHPMTAEDRKLLFPLSFEARSTGLDAPVMIEREVREAHFLASTPNIADITFELQDPQGRVYFDESNSFLMQNVDQVVRCYQVVAPMSGRWFMRLRRAGGKDALPFRMDAICANRRIGTFASVSVNKQLATFAAQVAFQTPLDHLAPPVVDIHYTQTGFEDISNRVGQVVLNRSTVTDAAGASHILSDGVYEGSMKLSKPGIYSAVFRLANFGTASNVSNPEGILDGNLADSEQLPVPTFSRVKRVQFEID